MYISTMSARMPKLLQRTRIDSSYAIKCVKQHLADFLRLLIKSACIVLLLCVGWKTSRFWIKVAQEYVIAPHKNSAIIEKIAYADSDETFAWGCGHLSEAKS